MKYFTKRKFFGIFSAGGNLRFRNGNFPWPWYCIADGQHLFTRCWL